jgi:hypothetical protein
LTSSFILKFTSTYEFLWKLSNSTGGFLIPHKCTTAEAFCKQWGFEASAMTTNCLSDVENAEWERNIQKPICRFGTDANRTLADDKKGRKQTKQRSKTKHKQSTKKQNKQTKQTKEGEVISCSVHDVGKKTCTRRFRA